MERLDCCWTITVYPSIFLNQKLPLGSTLVDFLHPLSFSSFYCPVVHCLFSHSTEYCSISTSHRTGRDLSKSAQDSRRSKHTNIPHSHIPTNHAFVQEPIFIETQQAKKTAQLEQCARRFSSTITKSFVASSGNATKEQQI